MDSSIGVRSRGALIEVHIGDSDFAQLPELREPILWRELGELYGKGLVPLSFQILSFNLRESTEYQIARFLSNNYSRIRSLYRALKSAMNSRPVIMEVPQEADEETVEAFVDKLRQLAASEDFISSIDYMKESRIIRIERVDDAGFLLGGWLEIVLADTISSICPFREFLLLKNLKFRFKNVNNEIDTLLITDRGSLIFEAKSGFGVKGIRDICYGLLRKASLLDIPPERAFLIIPSIEDVRDMPSEGGFSVEQLFSGCFRIRVLTLANMRSELQSIFYEMMVSGGRGS